MARTTIEIDERLLARAMRMTGARSKREAVDIALRRLVRLGKTYARIRELRGKLPWDGDAAALRSGRHV